MRCTDRQQHVQMQACKAFSQILPPLHKRVHTRHAARPHHSPQGLAQSSQVLCADALGQRACKGSMQICRPLRTLQNLCAPMSSSTHGFTDVQTNTRCSCEPSGLCCSPGASPPSRADMSCLKGASPSLWNTSSRSTCKIESAMIRIKIAIAQAHTLCRHPERKSKDQQLFAHRDLHDLGQHIHHHTPLLGGAQPLAQDERAILCQALQMSSTKRGNLKSHEREVRCRGLGLNRRLLMPADELHAWKRCSPCPCQVSLQLTW